MPAHSAHLVQRAPPPPPPPPPDAQGLADAIREQVRQSVQGAIEGQQAAIAGNTAGARMAIDALRAEMNAEKANIEALTSQLVPGISEARSDAITSQISNAEGHLESLQNQLERALSAQAGTLEVPAPVVPDVVPQGAIEIVSIVFFTLAVIAIGVPIARAIARRLDRRGVVAPASPTIEPRLERIEQAIEAIAIEVERVSEGQRFTNKLMSEIRALPLPNAAEQWPQGRKEALAVERGRQE